MEIECAPRRAVATRPTTAADRRLLVVQRTIGSKKLAGRRAIPPRAGNVPIRSRLPLKDNAQIVRVDRIYFHINTVRIVEKLASSGQPRLRPACCFDRPSRAGTVKRQRAVSDPHQPFASLCALWQVTNLRRRMPTCIKLRSAGPGKHLPCQHGALLDKVVKLSAFDSAE